MSNSDSQPDVLDLLKAILLPGSDTVQDFASSVKKEAEDTKQLESINRFEGLALLLTVFALTTLVATLVFVNGWISTLVKVVGLPTTIMGAVAIPLLYIYVVIYVFRRIDAGESVLMTLGDFDEGEAEKLKLALGASFLSVSLVIFFSLETNIVWTVLVVAISLIMVGSLIVGLTCWLRVAISA